MLETGSTLMARHGADLDARLRQADAQAAGIVISAPTAAATARQRRGHRDKADQP
jgi:hypothetical protein